MATKRRLGLVIGIAGGLILALAVYVARRPASASHREVTFAVSPTGAEVAFSAPGGGGSDLYRLDLGARRAARVTGTPEYERDPSYSPDGRTLVFASAASEGMPAQIVLSALDGTRRRPVTAPTVSYDGMPSFSPDGSRIVFARAARQRPYSMGGMTWDQWDIFTVRVDGTGIQRLTSGAYYQVSAPSFSRDGKSVLYAADSVGPAGIDIWDAAADGRRRPRRLTTDGRASDPAFSADGKQITYIADRAATYEYEVWVMRSDGTSPRQVTHNGSYNAHPRFVVGSADILFLSDATRSGSYDLWEVDPRGRTARQIAGSGLFSDPMRWNQRASP